MKWFRRIIVCLFALLALPAAWVVAVTYSKADFSAIPELESADLIFQTHLSSQAPAVMLASGSLYSHAGIIHRNGNRVTVINALNVVSETDLKAFITGGWGERFTVMRNTRLTPEQKEAVVRNARRYLKRPYDFVFSLDNEAIYCSELPYLAFRDERLSVGTVQKIADLNLDNLAVRNIFSNRWKMHPRCQGVGMTAEHCWDTIMDESIITPAGLASDSQLSMVYTNYW